MPISKGLKSLAESTPNFSNQSLENAINNLKIGWVAKSIDLDTAIQNNSVLTNSQKNDLKDTINNIGYLNAGRYLGDLTRHTNTILDGTIVFLANPDIEDPATFLEILQLTQSIQTLIPSLFDVTAAEKNRAVKDHVGTLNNIFTTTEDSSRPVFDSILDSITFIDNAQLATATTYGTAIDNLKNFIDSVVGDSTDFQQTLDTFGSAVATAATNFDSTLQSSPYDNKRTQLIEDRDSINTQVSLENSNLQGIRTFVKNLVDNFSFTTLAEDEELRKLMSNVAQNSNWKTYFNDYNKNKSYINPAFNLGSDSDRSAIIDRELRSRGLPDVLDSTDLVAVSDKAKRDNRIDTKGFDLFDVETVITKSCEQLGISTKGSIYIQSGLLLSNLNAHDREIISQSIDLNQDAETLS